MPELVCHKDQLFSTQPTGLPTRTQDCSLLMHSMHEYLMDEEGPKFCEQSHMLLGSNNAVSRQTV